MNDFLPEDSVMQGDGWSCSVGSGWVRCAPVHRSELCRQLVQELKARLELLVWGQDEHGGIRSMFVCFIRNSNENSDCRSESNNPDRRQESNNCDSKPDSKYPERRPDSNNCDCMQENNYF